MNVSAKIALTISTALWIINPAFAKSDSAVDFSAYGPVVEYISAQEVSKYKTVWFVSDIHGRLPALYKLFTSNGLSALAPAIEKSSKKHPLQDLQYDDCKWSGGSGQLVLVVGDYIDKGGSGEEHIDRSAAVLRCMNKLRSEAKAKGSKIVLLLGNHDAEFMASGKNASDEMKASCDLEFKTKDADANAMGEAGDIIRSMPAAAVVGTWLVAHSGYVNVGANFNSSATGSVDRIKDYFKQLHDQLAPVFRTKMPTVNSTTLAQVRTAYQGVTEYKNAYGISSIIERHDWWKNNLDKMKTVIDDSGLTGLVVGHEPKIFDFEGVVGIKDGWAAKLDSGMSFEVNDKTSDHKGRMMKCEVSKMKISGGKLPAPGNAGCEEVDWQGKVCTFKGGIATVSGSNFADEKCK